MHKYLMSEIKCHKVKNILSKVPGSIKQDLAAGMPHKFLANCCQRDYTDMTAHHSCL